jgi:hypothetical protein
MTTRFVTSALLWSVLAVTSFAAAEETFEQLARNTDPKNAEQVFALAQWCQEHKQTNRVKPLLLLVIKLDPEHLGARTALGQVKEGDKWVMAPPANKPTPKPVMASNGPLPKASSVDWKLSLPVDPDPSTTFIDAYIAKLPTIGNESAEMDAAIATMLLADNLPSALPRLCKALQRPEFTDLYGASQMIVALMRTPARASARTLYPFVAVASSRFTDPDELLAFILATTAVHDRRALPRLIELMQAANTDVATAATDCAAELTGLPAAGLTVGEVGRWWNRFATVDERTILRTQMASKQPAIALKAAEQLALTQDKNALDTLITLMLSDDPKIASKAHELVTAFTGSDWGYTATDPGPVRLQRVTLLRKWWQDNRQDFVLILDPQQVKAAGDLAEVAKPEPSELDQLVTDLGSIDTKIAAKAEAGLLAEGMKAVAPLINGLLSTNPIIARHCQELLVHQSGRTDISFSPRDTASKKAAAVSAWQAWAGSKEAKHRKSEAEGRPGDR